MYTRCPACLTVFRISSADLRAADGEVVCGRCDAQFNALTSLSETPEEATAVLRPAADAAAGAGDPDLSQTGAEPLWDIVARGAVAAGQPGRAADPEPRASDPQIPPSHEPGDGPVTLPETFPQPEGPDAAEASLEGTAARSEPDEVASGGESPTHDGDSEGTGPGETTAGAEGHGADDHRAVPLPDAPPDSAPLAEEQIEATDRRHEGQAGDDEATAADDENRGEPVVLAETGVDAADGEVVADPERTAGADHPLEAVNPGADTAGGVPDDVPQVEGVTDRGGAAEADGGESVFLLDDDGDLVSVDTAEDDDHDGEAESAPEHGLRDASGMVAEVEPIPGDAAPALPAEAAPAGEGPSLDEADDETTLPAGVAADNGDAVAGEERARGDEASADAASEPGDDDVEQDDEADLEAALEAELNALADQAAEEWAVATGVNEQPDFAASGHSGTESITAGPPTADETSPGPGGEEAVEEAAVEIDIDDDPALDIGQPPETRIGDGDHRYDLEDGAEDRDGPETRNAPAAVPSEDTKQASDDGDIDDADLEFDVPQDRWDEIWDPGPESPGHAALGDGDAGGLPAGQEDGAEVIVLQGSETETDDTEPEQSPAAAEAGFSMPAGARPAAFEEHAERAPKRSRWWLAAAVLLGLFLLLQWVHYNRASLLTHPTVGPALGGIYEAFGAEPRPAWELGSFRILESAGVQDPANPGTLKLSVRFSNSAAVPQPLPLLRVTLEDRWGEPVAMRDFAPREYIASVTGDQRLSPGKATQGNVTIVDPGPTADGYRLDLCYPDGSEGAYCLGDLPGR